jgi:hypothetical protein
LPYALFAEPDYRKNEERGFAGSLKIFAAQRDLDRRPVYVLGLEGMWGGLHAVGPAREFLRTQLLSARWTLPNLFHLGKRLPTDAVTIGFHIRRGDFKQAGGEGFQAKFNLALPLDWYVAIAKNLLRALGGRIQLLVVSDAEPGELEPFGKEIPCAFTNDCENRDISDLMALSNCDLLICSVSSYSEWAAFFSTGRYIWYGPNLGVEDGLASIWGHEKAQRVLGGQTALARASVANWLRDGQQFRPKGIAIGSDGAIPDEMFAFLEERLQLSRWETDLIRYGVTPGRPSG